MTFLTLFGKCLKDKSKSLTDYDESERTDDDDRETGKDSESFILRDDETKEVWKQVFFSIGDLTAEQRSRVWYRRLGMPSLKMLQKATKEGTMKGLQVTSRLAIDDDPTVIQARFKAAAYKGGELDTSKLPPFHTMSVDEVSGFPCATIGGATSAFVAICHATNWIMVFLVKSRGQFPEVLAAMIAEVSSFGDYELCRVWSDSAPEIQSGQARNIARQYGIKLEPTGVHCPAAGGKHESAVQLVVHRTLGSMLLAPWMPPRTWGLAMLNAKRVLNLTVTGVHGLFLTPFQRVTGRAPDLRRQGVHVWGCGLSYGLTKQERMAAPRKKMSELTREFQFAGVEGNMVLMRDGKSGKIYQGNRQKCHFYEGIFTMRNPPKQMNPLALMEAERKEYMQSLRAHGLVTSDTSKDGKSESEGDELVRSIRNLKSVTEIYDAIRDNFARLESGGEKILDFEENCKDSETCVLDESQIVPMKVHDADKVIQEPEDPVTEKEEEKPEEQEPIAKRMRRTRKPVETTGATEKEVQEKMSSYGTLHHPEDGSTATVINATQRKHKSSGEPTWWLKLRWDCGFEKWYHEESMRKALGLDTMGDKNKPSYMTMFYHTVLTCLMVEPEDEEQSEEWSECCEFLYAAMATKKPFFPKPEKSWPDCKNAYECLQAPDWKGWVWAARMEKQSWLDEAVFKVCRKIDRDRRRNTYPLNDIWTRKWLASDGSFDKHKCRLVVLGNLFKRGIDCATNTWAPTVSATAVRVFLMLAVQQGYPIWKFDVKTAFLLAMSDGKYYCFYPAMFRLADMDESELTECRRIATEGTEQEKKALKRQLCGKYSDDDDRVLEIIKSVYGSPSAPRSFYLHFREILTQMGFGQTVSEPCLFQKRIGKHTIRIVLHVDDGAVSGPEKLLKEFFAQLQTKVKITMSKEVNDFTGLGVKYDMARGMLKIHLRSTIEDATRRFKTYFPKRVYASKTPLPPGTIYEAATDAEFEEAKHLPYQQLIGCLVWITVQVKIEAAAAVSMLGSHAAKWSQKHFEGAIKVLLWMERTKDKGLEFSQCSDFDRHDCLYAFADADLAGDHDSRRSRSGMAIMMGSRTRATCISHRSALQKTIALSTTAAEIVALIEAAMPVEGIRALLQELGMPQTKPTVVYEDNQPAIAVVQDAAKPVGGTTKFYDMRIKKLKEMQRDGTIALTYCRTSEMLADMFTKNVNHVIFEKLAELLTGRGGSHQELRAFLCSCGQL